MIGRTNCGGGGGLSSTDALLRVQAPAGSTVTITKGVLTKTDLGHENADDHSVYDYYFIIHQSQFDSVNPWTVTATLGADSASDTVTIDSADEYDVELAYYTYIYKDGTQVVALTDRKGSNGRVNYLDSYIECTNTTTTSGGIGVFTANKVDITDYSTLVFMVDYRERTSSSYPLKMGISSNIDLSPTYAAQTSPTVNSGVIQTVTVDISSNTGSYYISLSGIIKANVYKIYLIK